MSEEWNFFPCSFGDDQSSIFVDTGVAKTIGEAPGNVTRLDLAYKAPDGRGLPTRDEFDAVNAIEDEITAFSKQAGDWYVGRITTAGHRYFFIYTQQTEAAWIGFCETFQRNYGYPVKAGFRHDPEHEDYWDDLYPKPDDWQVIKDMQVLEQLRKHEDDNDVERPVDHWLYFPDETKAQVFMNWAEEQGVTLLREPSGPRDNGEFCVRLQHIGTMQLGDITSWTIGFRQRAEEFGGRYDGWETQVTNAK